MTAEFSDTELLRGLEMLQQPGILLTADDDYKSYLVMTYKDNESYLARKGDYDTLGKFLHAFNPVLKQRLIEVGLDVEKISGHEVEAIRAKIAEQGSMRGNN